MTILYLCLAWGAALGFYLACAHQQLWPGARRHARALRAAAWACLALSAAAAMTAIGTRAGAFAALTALMGALVLLPYLDACRRIGKERAHVD